MPKQKQNDIPTAAQNAANDAFALRCGAIGAISLGFGLAWWLVLELVCGLLDMSASAFKAGMDWGLVPAMLIGAIVGVAITSRELGR